MFWLVPVDVPEPLEVPVFPEVVPPPELVFPVVPCDGVLGVVFSVVTSFIVTLLPEKVGII